MAAAMNGMALHGGVIPYSGTFLVFSDYCRPAIRLAALMGERVIHVMTHDFDRPRRGRPDAPAGRAPRRAARDPEPAGVPPVRRGRDHRVLAAGARMQHDRPSVLALTRQNLPQLRLGHDDEEPLRRRRLRDRRRPNGDAEVSLFASGSEVAIAVEARKFLRERGVDARASFRCRASNCSRRSRRPSAPRSSARAGQGRGRGRDPAGLGRDHRLRRRLRRHDRLRRQRAGTRNSTSISASRPRRSPRRR